MNPVVSPVAAFSSLNGCGEAGIAEEEGTSFRASVGTLHQYLGSPRFLPDEEQNHPQVGQAMGLAWTQTGGAIIGSIRAQAARRSVIIVSHRLSALSFADRILVMDQGRLVERGLHADLLAQTFLGTFFSYTILGGFLQEELQPPLSDDDFVAQFVKVFVRGTQINRE